MYKDNWVEVFYATPEAQKLITIDFEEDLTVKEAILKSNIVAAFPELNLADIVVGIYSKKVSLDDKVKPGDRIEIYRNLVIDPKVKRKLLAKNRSKLNRAS